MLSARVKLVVVRCVAWMLASTIAALSVIPASSRPVTSTGHNFEHLAIFLTFGFTFTVGYHRSPTRTLFHIVLFASLIEIVQIFIPGRHARLFDFCLDAAASGLGWLLAITLFRWWPALQIDRTRNM